MILRSALIAAVGIAMLTSSAYAATYTVSPGQSIQQAISSAGDGDTIRVLPGTYFEQITFAGKAITLESTGGADQTFLDASPFDDGSVVSFVDSEGTDSRLVGFTIRGGKGSPRVNTTVGGGIYIWSAGPTIFDCILEDNEAGGGGGLAQVSGYATIGNCEFRNNTATFKAPYGGGAILATMGSMAIMNCRFQMNESTGLGGGGAIVFDFTWASVVNSLVTDNSTFSWGGGILNRYGNLQIVNCTASNNHAGYGGGGVCTQYSSSVTELTNTIVWNNTAGYMGPQLYDDFGAASELQFTNLSWDSASGTFIGANPAFDNGTYELSDGSACIDAGNNDEISIADVHDLDGDGDRSEPVPDLELRDRIFGGAAGQVDLGAYEFQGDTPPDEEPPLPCPDMNGDGEINVFDLLDLLTAFGNDCGGCPGDANANGSIDVFDLIHLLESWGSCEP